MAGPVSITANDVSDYVAGRLSKHPNVLPEVDVLTAINTCVRLLVNRLLLFKSDLLDDIITASVGVGNNEIEVPEGFVSIREYPYYSGETTRLYPRGDISIQSMTETGKPCSYDLRATKLYLYPLPDDDYTVIVPICKKPALLTTYGDDIPFNGFFDEFIKEATMKIMASGPLANGTREVEKMAISEIDRVVCLRANRLVYWRNFV